MTLDDSRLQTGDCGGRGSGSKSPKGHVVDEELSDLLIGASKNFASARLPTQRREAIQFKYQDVSDKYSMTNIGNLFPSRPANEVNKSSSSYRDMYRTRSDSWETELCVGIAIKMILRPRWEAVKQLGRSLIIFKVHKDPQICEVFFMKQAEVVATYKERLPRAIEWTNLYDINAEMAFWAELYQPTNRSGHKSRSFLTDELCGGFGSRFYLAGDLSPDKFEEIYDQITKPPDEVAEISQQAQARLDKKRRQRVRTKQKKADARAAGAKDVVEEVDDKGACIVCFDAPSSWIFEGCKHLCLCRNCAMNVLDQSGEPTSKKCPKMCPLCRQESRLVHIDNYSGDGDNVFGEDVFDA